MLEQVLGLGLLERAPGRGLPPLVVLLPLAELLLAGLLLPAVGLLLLLLLLLPAAAELELGRGAGVRQAGRGLVLLGPACHRQRRPGLHARCAATCRLGWRQQEVAARRRRKPSCCPLLERSRRHLGDQGFT
jgi:hypothetical protein